MGHAVDQILLTFGSVALFIILFFFLLIGFPFPFIILFLKITAIPPAGANRGRTAPAGSP